MPFKTRQRTASLIRHSNIIKQKMNVTRFLLEDIKTKQFKRYGHAQRMEKGRLPKKVMKWSPPGRRKRGIPKLTWAEEPYNLHCINHKQT